MQQYANTKTPLLSHERFARLCTDTTLLLTDHSRQARYALLQQGRLTQLAQHAAKAYRLKATLYRDTSREARRTIYFARKRTRERWDPTLWEILPQPLPKRQQAHSDPNEWEIPPTCRYQHQRETMGTQSQVEARVFTLALAKICT